MDGEGVKKTSDSLKYKILIPILGFIIVCLVIGIVVVTNNNRGNNDDTEDAFDESSLPEELQGDNLSPEDQVVKQVSIMSHTPGVTPKDIEEYYDSKINEANDNGDHRLAADIIARKLIYIVTSEEDCLRAKTYSDKIDTSDYSDEEKSYLYSRKMSILLDCEDEPEEEW